MGSGDPTNRFSANSNASLILLYNCPNFRYFSTKNFDALEFAKINIFGIGIHHTSLQDILFAWTLSVLTQIFVKATRVPRLPMRNPTWHPTQAAWTVDPNLRSKHWKGSLLDKTPLTD